MKTPKFWHSNNAFIVKYALGPLSGIYGAITRKRTGKKPDYNSAIPVVCVGNINMGGTGKTPITQSIARILQSEGKHPAILLRGYGGSITTATRVDAEKHTAKEVGDEAILHAQTMPTFVSPDRVKGAKLIEENGDFDVIIMDDGFQNPHLAKDVSLVVVDGIKGFGNNRIFPAGPLRETVEDGLARADALIIMGQDKHHLADEYKNRLPIFPARFAFSALDIDNLKTKDIVGFAGIGHPDKFFHSLEVAGLNILSRFEFADHRPYEKVDLLVLRRTAQALKAPLVTTMKDYVRLPKEWRKDIIALDGTVVWGKKDALLTFFEEKGILEARNA